MGVYSLLAFPYKLFPFWDGFLLALLESTFMMVYIPTPYGLTHYWALREDFL